MRRGLALGLVARYTASALDLHDSRTSMCIPAVVTGRRDERVRVMAGLNMNLGIKGDVEASLTPAGSISGFLSGAKCLG